MSSRRRAADPGAYGIGQPGVDSARARAGVLDGLLLVGALVSLTGIALLLPLPWSVFVGAALLAAELWFYRRLQAERGEDDFAR